MHHETEKIKRGISVGVTQILLMIWKKGEYSTLGPSEKPLTMRKQKTKNPRLVLNFSKTTERTNWPKHNNVINIPKAEVQADAGIGNDKTDSTERREVVTDGKSKGPVFRKFQIPTFRKQKPNRLPLCQNNCLNQ